MVSIQELVAVAKAAAIEAADHQERFAAEDTEARKIVDTMERFLRIKKRIVYGGAAINAHLPSDKKFYDPTLYLPDYDFLTPDPLQDCADLIVAFQEEGFKELEAKFGIHEGTYKVFVNFRAAADITYMPRILYDRIRKDSTVIGGIHYASVNYLRMNMYLELSRPAGMVTRWEKVYERLLLLNEAHPLRPGRCATVKNGHAVDRIVQIGMEEGVIFLSKDQPITLMITDRVNDLVARLRPLKATRYEAVGELLPARVELHDQDLVAVIFEAVACHNYTMDSPKGYGLGYRIGSLDLLIQMYYALYFADVADYLPIRPLCIIRDLIESEMEGRAAVANGKGSPHDVFPLECIGHQPSIPELKKAHRNRVAEKRKDLVKALRKTRRRPKHP